MKGRPKNYTKSLNQNNKEMTPANFNKAISYAEGILEEKGFFKPTDEFENFEEFRLYQPITVRPGFIMKKIDRATAKGEKAVFEIYVKGTGDPTFVEIFQRIHNVLI